MVQFPCTRMWYSDLLEKDPVTVPFSLDQYLFTLVRKFLWTSQINRLRLSDPHAGLDDAMRKCLTHFFPRAYIIVCVRHLRQNVSNKLNEFLGKTTDARLWLMSLFGTQGKCHMDRKIIAIFPISGQCRFV